jgi:hypothetical protein
MWPPCKWVLRNVGLQVRNSEVKLNIKEELDNIGFGFVWHKAQEKNTKAIRKIINLEANVKSAPESVRVKCTPFFVF